MATATVLKAVKGQVMASVCATIPDAQGHPIEYHAATSVTDAAGNPKSAAQIQADLTAGLSAAYKLQTQQDSALTLPTTLTV